MAVGDVIAGTIEASTHRVAYTLKLDSTTVLDIFAMGTGPRTADSIGSDLFDPMLFIYDVQGSLLYWNDEGPGLSMHKGGVASDAGLTAVSLNAGVYAIQVAGYGDLNAGPYALIVRKALESQGKHRGRANRILVIENGRIAEMGSRSELLRARGHYYRLYTRQLREELEQDYDPFAVQAEQIPA